MGHLLRRKGVLIAGEIGSMQRFLGVALANTKQPELVLKSHLDYLESGASVITTNNYSCVPAAIEHSLSSTNSTALWDKVGKNIQAAGKCANEAREQYQKLHPNNATRVQIAGCVPPLHESYRFDRVGTDEEMIRDYALIVNIIKTHSDFLLCETLSSVRETSAAAQAAGQSGLPVWVSWTLHEDATGNLRSSESLEEAVDALKGITSLQACLLNCSSCESITAAIPRLREKLKKEDRGHVRIGAYANGFVTVKSTSDGEMEGTNSVEYRQDLTPQLYMEEAKEWVRLGATIVGGCCGVFPEHINALHKEWL